MDRRSFLRASAAVSLGAGLPVSIANAPCPEEPAGLFQRISCEKGDRGYRAYCMARGDDKTVMVYLNGEPQRYALTADANEGWVKRFVSTPAGNIAHDGREVLTEIVHGTVTIEIV